MPTALLFDRQFQAELPLTKQQGNKILDDLRKRIAAHFPTAVPQKWPVVVEEKSRLMECVGQ